MAQITRTRTKGTLIRYTTTANYATNGSLTGVSQSTSSVVKDTFRDNDEPINPALFPYWKPCWRRIRYGGSVTSYSPTARRRVIQTGVPLSGESIVEDAINTITADNLLKVQYKMSKLKFQSNNKFNIIVALLELDETIRAFLAPLTLASYGGYQWGIKPLISDVKSIINSFKDIYEGRIYKQLENRRCYFTHTEKTELISGTAKFTITVKTAVEGNLSFDTGDDPSPIITALRIILDEIGFHPDINTLWDAIPLSFMVDYWIPIGDLLQKVHPQGWFRPVITFSGGATHECEVFRQATTLQSTQAGYSVESSTAARNVYFIRSGGIALNSTQVENDLQYEAPTGQEWFNTTYLLAGRKARLPF